MMTNPDPTMGKMTYRAILIAIHADEAEDTMDDSRRAPCSQPLLDAKSIEQCSYLRSRSD